MSQPMNFLHTILESITASDLYFKVIDQLKEEFGRKSVIHALGWAEYQWNAIVEYVTYNYLDGGLNQAELYSIGKILTESLDALAGILLK